MTIKKLSIPLLGQPDPNVPLADTLGALDELVKSGKVREIGCSNLSAAQLSEAALTPPAGAARFVSVQNEYSLLHREPEREVLPVCTRFGLAFIPYFPLASGLLTGKFAPGSGRPRAAACRCRGRRDSRLSTTSRSWPPCRPSSRHAGELCSLWRCPGWPHGRRCHP